MASLEELDDLLRDNRDQDNKDKKDDKDADMKDAEEEEKDAFLDEEILTLSTQDILMRKKLLENDSRIMKSEFQRLSHEKATMAEKIKENREKIANNRCAARRLPRPPAPTLTEYIDNCRTSSETWWSCWTSIPRPSRWRRAPTSTSMPHGSASRP